MGNDNENIQVVITIPDKTYSRIQGLVSSGYFDNQGIIKSVMEKVADGAVLPKGHGDLKDAEAVLTIPDNPTNGDMIKALFPEDRITELNDCILVIGSEYQYQHHYPKDWWNAPYIEMDKTLSDPDAGK